MEIEGKYLSIVSINNLFLLLVLVSCEIYVDKSDPLTRVLSFFFFYIKDAEDEWKEWNTLGDPVLHIDLRDWADLLLIAPLSAHTLAKLAHGLCDDTLSCVVRAWDFGHGPRPGKPILLAPAMNTAMWQHPLTRPQLDSLQGFWNTAKNPKNGISVIAPQVKTLACGEVGNGALAAVDDIVRAVEVSLN
jgi:phosphopantothenoylcysteine decarboxylase